MTIPTENNSLIKVLGLALSLPSLVFALGWGMHKAVKIGVVSKPLGLIIFLAIIFNTFYLMVRYAAKKKN